MLFHPTPAFKAYLTAQRELQAEYLADENTKDIHGRPCSCPQCKCTQLDQKITDTMEHVTMEYELVCKDCLTRVAYWAHGNFEPNYPPEYSPSYF